MALKFLRFPKVRKVRRVKKREQLLWLDSVELEKRISNLIISCNLTHINPKRVYCYVSTGAKTRAYARIWGLGRIFQQALKIEPAYVIEAVSEKFDRLTSEQQEMVIIHELLHIPKSFSGALVPHRHKGGVNDRVVREVYVNMLRTKKTK
ncbi:MAG: hypothetical protein G01um10145_96 [Microgenomates group bacterium Gr01-1014_5]|nr:MAG: hypothetical protein G01um10145_96 [Microgenomates group bacterium Gr01-1014_5]